MLIRIEAPHYVAGIIVEDGVCKMAAPILSWSVGKKEEFLLNYFKKKNFDIRKL